MSELERLREEIRDLDGELLRIVARRMDVARRIGRIKRAGGVPLRDWDVERRVLDRAAERAATHNLPSGFVRNLMQQVIAESRATQERSGYAEFAGQASDIAVVGGRGRMGAWLVDFFRNQGHRVRIVEVDTGPDDVSLAEAARVADMVVLATPLEVVPDALAELTAGGYRGMACDVASLKSHLVPAIEAARAAGMRYTSLHPMFGPGVQTLSDQVLVLCDCGDPEATAEVRRFFEQTAVTLVELSLSEHDRIASYVLGLSHLINIVFAGTLRRSELPYQRFARIGSTTFHSQMNTTGTVIREQPELYYRIQALNAYRPQLYEALRAELQGLCQAVESGDQEAFVHSMRQARAWIEA